MVRKRRSDAGKPKKPKAGQSFAEKCPEKAAQWDYERNDDTPYDVGSGSHDRRWFICPECGRNTERIICQFAKTKSVACQYCAGRWFRTGVNDLLTKAPDVAAQLNDGSDPSQIYYLSKDKHEFKCKHGHIVTTQVYLRVRHECKLCANEIIGRKSAETRIKQNGSLLDNRPDIVERYWDYDANAENGIYPDKIGTGYRGNVVLHDDNGHRFVCRITEVIRGRRTKCTDCAMADERKRRRDEAIKKNGSFADNHPELISEINDGTDLTKIATYVRVPVNANDAREFIIDNDINEFIPADEYYGLMWEGMLVAVAGINIINHIVMNYSVLHGYDIIDGMNALCPHVPVLIDDCTPCIHDASSDCMTPMLFPCLKSFDADNVMFDAGSSLWFHR